MTDIEILETTYDDKCTIYRYVEIEDEDGITKLTKLKIYENIKCAVDKVDEQIINVDGVGNINFTHMLFLNPAISIIEGDSVEVTKMGTVVNYLASVPFLYPSHSETMITIKGRV